MIFKIAARTVQAFQRQFHCKLTQCRTLINEIISEKPVQIRICSTMSHRSSGTSNILWSKDFKTKMLWNMLLKTKMTIFAMFKTVHQERYWLVQPFLISAFSCLFIFAINKMIWWGGISASHVFASTCREDSKCGVSSQSRTDQGKTPGSGL